MPPRRANPNPNNIAPEMQQMMNAQTQLMQMMTTFIQNHNNNNNPNNNNNNNVTPSESALCKFQRNPPNPHRNDSKVPTRHFRAGGKRSNNITQQSSMGPTGQIYIQHDSMSQEYRYTVQDPNHLENDRASDYEQDAHGAKSPEEQPLASITLPRPSR